MGKVISQNELFTVMNKCDIENYDLIGRLLFDNESSMPKDSKRFFEFVNANADYYLNLIMDTGIKPKSDELVQLCMQLSMLEIMTIMAETIVKLISNHICNAHEKRVLEKRSI